jgi:hypothetical protein
LRRLLAAKLSIDIDDVTDAGGDRRRCITGAGSIGPLRCEAAAISKLMTNLPRVKNNLLGRCKGGEARRLGEIRRGKKLKSTA